MESLERMSEGVECMKGEGERHVSPQQVLDDLSLIRVGRERGRAKRGGEKDVST